jgi:hypothetical protein
MMRKRAASLRRSPKRFSHGCTRMDTDKKYSFIRVYPWPTNNPRSYQTHAEARQNIHSVVIAAINCGHGHAHSVDQHSPSVTFSLR